MAYFYGWTHEYIASMPISLFEDYWEMITVIEAQNRLVEYGTQDWPNMKKSERSKLHKVLSKQSYPASFKEAKQVSNNDLARILSGG